MELAIQVNSRITRIRSKVSLKSMTFILVSLMWSSHFLAVILIFFLFEHFNACWVDECRFYERLTNFLFPADSCKKPNAAYYVGCNLRCGGSRVCEFKSEGCHCKPGYTLNGDDECIRITECKCKSGSKVYEVW